MSQVVIKLAVDVVGALESQSMDGNVFAIDTNRRLGSLGNGTDGLQTAVSPGMGISWMIAMIECEVYASIENIVVDKAVMEPARKQFPGTSVSYWSGEVKRSIQKPITYDLVLKVGSLKKPMVHTGKLGLISASTLTEKGGAQ